MKKLRLILGDQLNQQHSWFRKRDNDVLYVMLELWQEQEYVLHHAQKILGFFAAMRQFAAQLTSQGHRITYITIDSPIARDPLTTTLSHLIKKYQIEQFEYQEPDEFRLVEQLSEFCQSLAIPSRCVDSEHFLNTRTDLANFFQQHPGKIRLEHFYRQQRQQHQILLTPRGTPIGGKWNYDVLNRKHYDGAVKLLPAWQKNHDLTTLWQLIEKLAVPHFGAAQAEQFPWPLGRQQALLQLQYFCRHLLAHFGQYQDAMTTQSMSLFHSRLSFALNTKMLTPREVIQKAIDYWQTNQNSVPLSSLEGFVRQILGWREYVRGIYWQHMPNYRELNYFHHQRPLPNWYWNGKTKMHCLQTCISQSLSLAYAHHIQRLMITGNFALLAGIQPQAVHHWYLGIYIDAIEWVELPNTLGMSQFADGGLLGSKPYVSSANYINKMSDFCQQCYYDPKQKSGPRACPFNVLYWQFHARHAEKLTKNPRLRVVYQNWKKKPAAERETILSQAEQLLKNIERL